MSNIINKKCSFPICSSNVEHNHVCNGHDILNEAPESERCLKMWFCRDCYSCMSSKDKICKYCNHKKSNQINGWARRRTLSEDYLPVC